MIEILAVAISISLVLVVILSFRLRSVTKRLSRQRVTMSTNETAHADALAAHASSRDYVAHLAHEIRSPLGLMVGFIDLLEDPDTTIEERSDYVRILKRNSDQLASLVNNVLDYSKVEAGRIEPEVQLFCLRSLLTEIIDSFQIQARQKGNQLELTFDGPDDALIETDPTRLKQIVWNLVANAVKFTDQGKVGIIAKVLDQSVTIDIEDSGLGIDPENHARLFIPFSQANESITRQFGGTGLGLALSRSLAEVLGGTIALKQSVIGKGSTFRIEFPQKRVRNIA